MLAVTFVDASRRVYATSASGKPMKFSQCADPPPGHDELPQMCDELGLRLRLRGDELLADDATPAGLDGLYVVSLEKPM